MAELIDKGALKPCPFCGGKATLKDCGSGDYKIECENNCIAGNNHFTKKNISLLYEAWNNRATEAEIRASVIAKFAEKLKDFIAKQVEDAESSNDLCTEIFQSEIDEIAEQLKEE